MNVKTDPSRNQIYNHYLLTSGNFTETDPQRLGKLLLAELHSARHWQKQTLAEAATEIQALLTQLQKTNPMATKSEQKAFVTSAIPLVRREQFLGALQAGWKEAIQEFLDNSFVNVGIATLEDWKATD
ncbi:MAG TPA: hypothetical protein V6C95_18640 [Coleofasciculaceae cyanobacterium]